MHTFEDAAAKLGNRDSRKLGNNTYLRKRGDDIAVQYHETDVITFKGNGSIVLNSGGWHTSTTKERLNDYSPFRIRQDKGVWYVSNGTGTEVTFEDGMSYKKGRWKGAGPEPSVTEKKRKKAREFAHQFIEQMKEYKVSAPGAGDCFYCQMREVETHKPVGEVFRDKGHIESHLKEKYFVPSLLRNALDWRSSQVDKWLVASAWKLNADPADVEAKKMVESFGSSWKGIERTLARYLYLQLGL